MQIKNYKIKFIKALTSIYDEMEIESFFYIVLEHLHQLKRIDLALQPGFEISENETKKWENILTELKKQKPIQYIIGETEFYGLKFLVNENVLIPRQETEELVEWIVSSCELRVEALRQAQCLKVLDIGTGSGCIAISLAKNIINSEVTAIDVSEKALEIAQKNAELNGVEVKFILKDILNTEDLEETFDIIVSNPPYVRNLEKHEIKPNVLDNEPQLALFVEDDDALLFYRKITELAMKNLSENGKLYFEINQYLGKETVELLEKLGFRNVELKKDIYGNDRMICCSK